MNDDYKIETFVQTLKSGKKRIVVQLFKVKRVLIKQHFIDIEEGSPK